MLCELVTGSEGCALLPDHRRSAIRLGSVAVMGLDDMGRLRPGLSEVSP